MIVIFKFQPYTLWALLVTILLLQACTTATINRDYSTSVGFWEQDENTDPSFLVQPGDSDNEIGNIYVDGDQVYVNGALINETSPLKNNSFVRTGSRSSVRIEFDTTDNGCQIQIKEFRMGKGFAHSTSCQHIVVTKHAEFRARSSVYHLHVTPWQTVATVLTGTVVAGLRSIPGQDVAIHQGQEAVLSSDSIIGPRQVPDTEIDRRIDWRNKYQFVESAPAWGVIAGIGAVAAAIAGIVIWAVTQDNGDPPPRGRQDVY